jgi:hypothetical protein
LANRQTICAGKEEISVLGLLRYRLLMWYIVFVETGWAGFLIYCNSGEKARIHPSITVQRNLEADPQPWND